MQMRESLDIIIVLLGAGGMVKPLSQDWELAVRPHRAPSVVSLSKAFYPHCNFSTDSYPGRSGKRNTQEGLGSI